MLECIYMTQEEQIIKNSEVEHLRQPATVYDRVVGWITPLHARNKGKQAEHSDRVVYQMSKVDLT